MKTKFKILKPGLKDNGRLQKIFFYHKSFFFHIGQFIPQFFFSHRIFDEIFVGVKNPPFFHGILEKKTRVTSTFRLA